MKSQRWVRGARVVKIGAPILLVLCLLSAGSALGATPAQEVPPSPITYTGTLQRPDGSPVADGGYNFEVRLFAEEAGGAPLWAEAFAAVAVAQGAFTLSLGESSPLPAAGASVWLELAVQGPGEPFFTVLAPRESFDLKEMPPAPAAEPAAVDALSCTHTHLGEYWSRSSTSYNLNIRNTGTGDSIRAYSAATNPDFAALYGVISATGQGSGVFGIATNGFGVRGVSTGGPGTYGASVNADGVMGSASAQFKSGVYGINTSTTKVGFGVYGRASKGWGLGADGYDLSLFDKLGDIELGGNHGEIFAPGTRLALYSNGNINLEIDDDNNDGNACARIYNGTDAIVAQWCENGTKSAVLQQEDGTYRAVYTIESPEVWLEDFGSGQLVNGAASIPFDAVFAQMINPNDYHVFVTPLGETNGLYVAEKGQAGFVVRELGGGAGSVAFDWRVTAHRLGLETLRAEVVAAGAEGK